MIKLIKTKLYRPSLFIVAIVISLSAIFLRTNQPVLADQYDEKIRVLQQNISSYQAESERLNQAALSLENELSRIANEKAGIQAQIDINQLKYDQLASQISETERQIKSNQDSLGKIIADMYVDDTISPIELIVSNKSISEFMDRQEQRTAIRNQLTAKIAEVKQLKTTLEGQKNEVSSILENQKSQRNTLEAKANEQANLLDQTKGQEDAYQQLISNSQVEINVARATQAAIAARLRNTGGSTIIEFGSLSEYPWNSSNCPMVGMLSSGGENGSGGDGWGYGCRQCASYVAWRIAKETGKYYRWGNATDFYANALNAGYQKSDPQIGSIGVMFGSTTGASSGHYYGHVVWVETDPYVDASGRSVIQISQYNAWTPAGWGMYSRQEVSVGAYDAYVKIK